MAATAATVALFSADSAVRAGIVALALGVAALSLAGNARLLSLYGLVLAAPLDLGKRFLPMPHMGGAAALRIEFVDLFIVTLLVFQLRDLACGYRDRRTMRLPALAASWIALMVLGCLFVAIGPLRRLAVFEVVRMLKCLLLFFVVVNEVVRLRQIAHLVIALLLSVALQGGIGLLQYGLGQQLGLKVLGEETEEQMKVTSEATLDTRETVNRVGGLLGHSNLLAAFLALVMPIGAALLFTQVGARIRLLAAVALLLGTAALLVTLSRTGWICFGAALLGVLGLGSLNPRTQGRHALRRCVALLALGVLLVAFSGPIMKRLTRSDPWAVRNRLEWLDVATKMIKEKPILGHGLNTFVYQMAPYTKHRTREAMLRLYGSNLPVVHNNYAIVWSEQGTIGLLVFLLLPLHVLYLGYRNLRVRHETLFAISVGCTCGMAVMMLDWLTSFSLRTEPLGRMYWVEAALLCAVDGWWRRNRGSNSSTKAPGPGRLNPAPNRIPYEFPPPPDEARGPRREAEKE